MFPRDQVILLVEDNPDDADLTLRALKKNNIPNKVVLVRDGAEALDYFFGDDTPLTAERMPVLVLLDLKLPKIDGLEVLRRLRQSPHTRLLPIIILTSSTEEEDILEGYRSGANSYIRKPVDFRHFTEAVRQLETYWLHLNELPPPGSQR